MATQYTYSDGTWGTLTIAGTVVCVNKWNFKGTQKSNDTPVSCVPGFSNPSPGMRSGSGSLTLFFDGTNLPNYQEGQIATGLVLGNMYADGKTTVVQVSAATIIIDGVTITNTPGSEVTYDIDFSTKGLYQYAALPTS